MIKAALDRLKALFLHLSGSRNGTLLQAENAVLAGDDAVEAQSPMDGDATSTVEPTATVSAAESKVAGPKKDIALAPDADHHEDFVWTKLSPRTRRFLREERNVDQVIKGLFIGDIHAAHDDVVLKELGVTHVVTALDFTEPAFPDLFEYLYLSLEDTSFEDISRHFDEAFAFIDSARKKGGKVFVHCFAGISRSSTIVTYYLARRFDVAPIPTALQFLRRHRPEVEPNFGFVRQLEEAFDRRKTTGRW